MADDEKIALTQDYIDRVRGVANQWTQVDHHRHTAKLANHAIVILAKHALQLAEFAELLLCHDCKSAIMPQLMLGQPYLCGVCGDKQAQAIQQQGEDAPPQQ